MAKNRKAQERHNRVDADVVEQYLWERGLHGTTGHEASIALDVPGNIISSYLSQLAGSKGRAFRTTTCRPGRGKKGCIVYAHVSYASQLDARLKPEAVEPEPRPVESDTTELVRRQLKNLTDCVAELAAAAEIQRAQNERTAESLAALAPLSRVAAALEALIPVIVERAGQAEDLGRPSAGTSVCEASTRRRRHQSLIRGNRSRSCTSWRPNRRSVAERHCTLRAHRKTTVPRERTVPDLISEIMNGRTMTVSEVLDAVQSEAGIELMKRCSLDLRSNNLRLYLSTTLSDGRRRVSDEDGGELVDQSGTILKVHVFTQVKAGHFRAATTDDIQRKVQRLRADESAPPRPLRQNHRTQLNRLLASGTLNPGEYAAFAEMLSAGTELTEHQTLWVDHLRQPSDETNNKKAVTGPRLTIRVPRALR